MEIIKTNLHSTRKQGSSAVQQIFTGSRVRPESRSFAAPKPTAKMNHSHSLPNFEYGSLFSQAPKRSGNTTDLKCMAKQLAAGDTRHAEMFVRDQLTSGLAPPASPLANILGGSAMQSVGSVRPQSKYDPNTGKFYRSAIVDTSFVPLALPATELLAMFCADGLQYNSSTHTGVVLNIASSITITCVGDTHVQADAMHSEVQERLSKLFFSRSDMPHLQLSSPAQNAAGITLFSEGSVGPAEKDCELVADSSAGLSLFSPVCGALQEYPTIWIRAAFAWSLIKRMLSRHVAPPLKNGYLTCRLSSLRSG